MATWGVYLGRQTGSVCGWRSRWTAFFNTGVCQRTGGVPEECKTIFASEREEFPKSVRQITNTKKPQANYNLYTSITYLYNII